MTAPVWISKELAIAIHARQLAEHGGMPGTRNEGLLESALTRAQNLHFYSEDKADLPAMAASYAYGIASNHPFFDGNKRTALVISRTFLRLNGADLVASKEDKYRMTVKLAAGELSEEELTAWFRRNTRMEGPAPGPAYGKLTP